VEKTGVIEIRIEGVSDGQPLSPDRYDIRELKQLLGRVEDLLFPGDRKERPVIGYRIEEGSVRHFFTTGMQAVLAFNAILAEVQRSGSIDFLESRTAMAIEELQTEAIKRNWSFQLHTQAPEPASLTIDATTSFQRTDDVWADVELYLYGKVTNAGGKEKANIHILVEDKGTFLVQTPQETIAGWDRNILYRPFGIRVFGRQNMATGEIDRASLRFIELIDHQMRFDKAYLSTLRRKAGPWLKGIDPDAWLNSIRGSDA
jgi:hypothetical protein